MAREQFRQPQNVTLKMPENASDDNIFDEAPPAKQALPEGWKEPDYSVAAMNVYPFNGAPVLVLVEGGGTHEANWRVAGALDPKTRTMQRCGFWSRRNSGGQRLGLKVIGYRRFIEAPLMGARL